MLLWGELQIDAKYQKFDIFENALYMKSGSTPLKHDRDDRTPVNPFPPCIRQLHISLSQSYWIAKRSLAGNVKKGEMRWGEVNWNQRPKPQRRQGIHLFFFSWCWDQTPKCDGTEFHTPARTSFSAYLCVDQGEN